jgi:hypothetical protein
MEITTETIRDFLDKQQHHITHYIVAQSYYHAYKKSDADIERMKQNIGKDLRYARNCFNRELYGNGARRKPQLYQPLLIATLEGTRETANRHISFHYNIYLGNIQKQLTTDDIKTLWTYCWVDKAQQKDDIYIAEARTGTQSQLLHYGMKEAQFGNTSCWDFANTQIPYCALDAD